MEPTRFDEMRRGSWDIHQRVADMDLNGVYASVNFPSFLPGFAGQRLQQITKDTDLALACVRAWNDWHLDAWAGPYPDRIIPCQLPWLLDAELGAEMIRENAERGFKAVTFSEAPSKLGLPDHPLGVLGAPDAGLCGDRDGRQPAHRVLRCLADDDARRPPGRGRGPLLRLRHLRRRRLAVHRSPVARTRTSRSACPKAASAGWPALLDRLDHMGSYSAMYGTLEGDLTPARCCSATSGSARSRTPRPSSSGDRIGVDHILVESDYPHCDSTWPNTQRVIEEELGGLPAEDIAKMTWKNASELYRHPVPEAVQHDPNAY